MTFLWSTENNGSFFSALEMSSRVSGPTSNVCVQGRAFPHTGHQEVLEYQQGIQEFNSVLTLSAQKWHTIPHVKGFALRCLPSPTPDTSCRHQALSCASAPPLQIGGSHHLSLRFDEFAGATHRTQKNTHI